MATRTIEQSSELARLKHELKNLEVGEIGERRTAIALDGLPVGWFVLNDLRRGGKGMANIDHVVVGPPGVFVIDSKNWRGRLSFEGTEPKCGGQPFTRQVEALLGCKSRVASVIGRRTSHVPVSAVICAANELMLAQTVERDGVAYVPVKDLQAWLLAQPRVLAVGFDARRVRAAIATGFPASSYQGERQRPTAGRSSGRLTVSRSAARGPERASRASGGLKISKWLGRAVG